MSAQARLSMVLSHLQHRTKHELRPEFPLLPTEERAKYNGEEYYKIVPNISKVVSSVTPGTFRLNSPSGGFDELFNFISNRISEECPQGNIAFCDVIGVLEGFECDSNDRILYVSEDNSKLVEEYNVTYSNLKELDNETITGSYEFVILNHVKSSIMSDLTKFIRSTNPNAIIITVDNMKNLSKFEEWNSDVFIADSNVKLSVLRKDIVDKVKNEAPLNMSQAYKTLNLPTFTELSLLKLELCTRELIEG
ncbi:uncharacterized protein SPAPADRAFT_50795 [Spathaspora passalidarum NRRL Y-27907]|uniref:Uncharacterized protein n=1 Tax=Spathaspora passalidarum (strain NRRL Y-27907 / 11-Y1) TaxID=619300 RepID=G3APQ3_SPAPN|nr:uncharacterized protein SPAPADRAFT_50795 [Spathaspora passalidarum NRRL Y-27907]EGW32225.1 hypothetical protein SPAPADRAFT_50795 [Spathaspora passalidarum NRRL Y-27907]